MTPDKLELAVFLGTSIQIHPLPVDVVLRIGRSEENDVPIDDAAVSRKHAVIAHGKDGLTLEDLGGPNGTTVRPALRGGAVETLSMRHVSKRTVPLVVGDTLVFGPIRAVVRRVAESPADEPIVADPVMKKLHDDVARAAAGSISVLLLGETGTGKEVLARALHRRSPRAGGPFLGLSCAALSESLLESELFGHEKGAFTGAVKAKAGLLESANGGTVFLDEIGEVPLAVQAKLLRVIEEKRVTRVGGLEPRALDVRFVSATNRDLPAEVRRAAFREDLFFRLAGVVLRVPPLRERRREIVLLAVRFVERAAAQLGRPTPTLTPAAVEALVGHSWPGNIRELAHAMERGVLFAPSDMVDAADLPESVTRRPPAVEPSPEPPPTRAVALSGALREQIQELERERMLDALEKCAGNQTRAAEMLGMSRRTFVTRLTTYGITRPRKR